MKTGLPDAADESATSTNQSTSTTGNRNESESKVHLQRSARERERVELQEHFLWRLEGQPQTSHSDWRVDGQCDGDTPATAKHNRIRGHSQHEY